ncbi:MAG: hypothetical protein GWM98_18670, partial [Nitrospinaceae bacterium]|nr:hypothetical protein [Nitrospinaceae bacterium]NIR56141.1 hypothetical protein [Nitrospinaceae bacterium]NIS86596.1 hypothetical protein [Nitrospinaceae bacterium]NIT83426.1 hypothetical protein [Nitrospinaceae bacterium]NIU45635.1 hypothetical protein [Nitrospinaceae bacterium]
VGRLQDFLDRWSFFVRFSKQCLDLSARRLNELLERCAFPRERSEVHLMTWTTTAFANFL